MAKGISTTAETTDQQFVANLYWNLLQRSPKDEEVKHWISELAKGVKRADVVEVFMSSSEFITLQSQRDRFQVSYTSDAEGTQPENRVLSRLQAHVARQQSTGYEEDHAAPSLENIGYERHDDTLPEEHVDEIEAADITNLSAQLWEAKEAVGQLNPRNPGFLNYLVQATKRIVRRSLTWYTRSLQNFHSRVAEALEEHGSHINSLGRSMRRADRKTSRLDKATLRLEKETLRLDSEISRLSTEVSRLQDGYLLDLLQANELAIQEQFIPYLSFFRETSPVVDIGCGRGEFLTLLKENGIPSYGVDSDAAACNAGRRKSLRVVNEDLLEHLRELPDRSLGGVFSARVIEFLPPHEQMELISLCSMKIKPGGVLVIETTNPDSRLGHGRMSYLDPTHLLAVPPDLMKSALERNCFRDVKITVLAPVEERLTQGTSAVTPVDSSERNDDVLPGSSSRLMLSPVYAAVGWRS